jgi:hypothetical protein
MGRGNKCGRDNGQQVNTFIAEVQEDVTGDGKSDSIEVTYGQPDRL